MGKVKAIGALPHVLDVRLNAPLCHVVVVWVDGCLSTDTSSALVERVGQQLTRALVVVLDLGHLRSVDEHAIATVRRLQVQAHAAGVELHLATERAEVRGALEAAGLHRSRPIGATAASVIALLPREQLEPTVPAGLPLDAVEVARWRRDVLVGPGRRPSPVS